MSSIHKYKPFSTIVFEDPIFNNNPRWNIDYLKSNKLTESFMDEFFNLLDWNILSRNQILSDSFMFKYIDSLPIFLLLKHQILSMELLNFIIINYPDDVDWNLISSRQKLDFDFISNYIDLLNLDSILSYQSLSSNSKNFILNYINDKIIDIDLDNPNERDLFDYLINITIH